MKACFTAIFPSLIRIQQISSTTKPHLPNSVTLEEFPPTSSSPMSSGQCTPNLDSGTMASMAPSILDKLLSLVQALLLQELRQSTLGKCLL